MWSRAEDEIPAGISVIFNAPERLLYLLPLVAAVVLLARKRKKPYITHPLLLQIVKHLRPASRWIYFPRILELLALAALLPALLHPVLPLVRYSVFNEGLDIILTVDLSGSMQEPMDLQVVSGVNACVRIRTGRGWMRSRKRWSALRKAAAPTASASWCFPSKAMWWRR